MLLKNLRQFKDAKCLKRRSNATAWCCPLGQQNVISTDNQKLDDLILDNLPDTREMFQVIVKTDPYCFPSCEISTYLDVKPTKKE